jgi:ankyrin repeat protein
MGGIIDQQATDGCTALQAAAEQGHTHIMEYLLEHSSDRVGTATAALPAAAKHSKLEGMTTVLAIYMLQEWLPTNRQCCYCCQLFYLHF